MTFKSGLLSIPIEKNKDSRISTGKINEVNIFIDHIGIPHIFGRNERGIAFGLGYMHAKDRYFQMELMSRTVMGELSEIFGKKALVSDTFWKPYEFKSKAEEILEEYNKKSPDLYKYLLEYTNGVNTYLDESSVNDPLYKIFNITPNRWKPEYCLLITWYMSKNLTYFDFQTEQQEIINKLSSSVKDFFFHYILKV